jgi:hypothetical protein
MSCFQRLLSISTCAAITWITPNELWFVRNHHPVPVLSSTEDYRLTIATRAAAGAAAGAAGPGSSPGGDSGAKDAEDETTLTLTLEDLKTKFPKRTVTASIQCGGNRRGGLDAVRKSSGTGWGCGAISTAEWAGASLREVLAAHGRAVQVDPIKPKLKPPGFKRLKLNCDTRLSTSAFNFKLRRYNTA